MSLADVLSALLEATPHPQPGHPPDRVLARFTAIQARRVAILAQLGPSAMLTAAELELAVQLEVRDAAWQLCLTASKHATADQRLGATRMRAYSP